MAEHSPGIGRLWQIIERYVDSGDDTELREAWALYDAEVKRDKALRAVSQEAYERALTFYGDLMRAREATGYTRKDLLITQPEWVQTKAYTGYGADERSVAWLRAHKRITGYQYIPREYMCHHGCDFVGKWRQLDRDGESRVYCARHSKDALAAIAVGAVQGEEDLQQRLEELGATPYPYVRRETIIANYSEETD